MEFFKTDNGVLHAGRFAGILYLISLLVSCGFVGERLQMCAVRSLSTVGWWLAFGGKHMPGTLAGLVAHPVRMTGAILTVLGIAGQFYVTWAFAPHS
jgi:hypothetical protein